MLTAEIFKQLTDRKDDILRNYFYRKEINYSSRSQYANLVAKLKSSKVQTSINENTTNNTDKNLFKKLISSISDFNSRIL